VLTWLVNGLARGFVARAERGQRAGAVRP
jgi:hypothetical protein